MTPDTFIFASFPGEVADPPRAGGDDAPAVDRHRLDEAAGRIAGPDLSIRQEKPGSGEHRGMIVASMTSFYGRDRQELCFAFGVQEVSNENHDHFVRFGPVAVRGRLQTVGKREHDEQ